MIKFPIQNYISAADFTRDEAEAVCAWVRDLNTIVEDKSIPQCTVETVEEFWAHVFKGVEMMVIKPIEVFLARPTSDRDEAIMRGMLYKDKGFTVAEIMATPEFTEVMAGKKRPGSLASMVMMNWTRWLRQQDYLSYAKDPLTKRSEYFLTPTGYQFLKDLTMYRRKLQFNPAHGAPYKKHRRDPFYRIVWAIVSAAVMGMGLGLWWLL